MAGGGIAGTGQDGPGMPLQRVQPGVPHPCQPARGCWRATRNLNWATERDGRWDTWSRGDSSIRAQTAAGRRCRAVLATLSLQQILRRAGTYPAMTFRCVSGELRHGEDCG